MKKMAPRVYDSTHAYFQRKFRRINFGAEYWMNAIPGLYEKSKKTIGKTLSKTELEILTEITENIKPSSTLCGRDLLVLCAADIKNGPASEVIYKKLKQMHYFDLACLRMVIDRKLQE